MRLLLIPLFYISILGWAWGDSLASKNNEGNKLYREGRVDEALSRWRGAQIENPDSDKLYYNIGNGLHGQKKYEDAFKEYEKSLNTKDSELQRRAYYNIGNTHYRMGKLLEAIEDYKKCLDIYPDDEDAKYNIEFVRKKIKENLKKEESKQTESQQKENKDQEQQKQDKSSGSQEEQAEGQPELKQGAEEKEGLAKEDKKEEERQEEGKEEKAEETSNREARTSIDEKEMSKEDAIRLLDAFKDDEEDMQKELRNQPIEGRYRVDKDW